MTPLAFLKALALGALIILLLTFARGAWMVATATSSALGKIGAASDSIAEIPAMANRRMVELQESLDRLPSQILPPLLARVDTATGKLDAQLTGARGDIALGIASGTQSVTQSVAALVAPLEGVRSDLKPVLVNTAGLVKDAQDSLDDSYWDGKAALESFTVATTQTAQTMQAVEHATPALLQDAQGIGKSFDGIAADVHTGTSDFVKPRTFWGKVKLWMETAGKIGARLL